MMSISSRYSLAASTIFLGIDHLAQSDVFRQSPQTLRFGTDFSLQFNTESGASRGLFREKEKNDESGYKTTTSEFRD
jgi:hypothetical protein